LKKSSRLSGDTNDGIACTDDSVATADCYEVTQKSPWCHSDISDSLKKLRHTRA